MTQLKVGLEKVYPIYIGGKWSNTKETYPLEFPYNGEVVTNVALATTKEAEEAVDSAISAKKVMAELPLWKRAEILNRAADLLIERQDALAELMVYETGKIFRDTKTEIARSASTLRFAADAARALQGDMIPIDAMKGGEGRLMFTIREPIGVIGAITGFNFPLLLAAHKVGPAIAGGNPTVLKPAPQTPLSSFELARIFEEAGLPKGGLSVITGDVEVGEYLVKHPNVPVISFTGSSEVGKRISEIARYKKVLLELGSNSATIIDKDSNIDYAIDRCVVGGFGASGQSCISVQRVYVHKEYYEEFLERLAAKINNLKIGNPFDEDTDVSTLISFEATSRVSGWVREAVESGARLLAGGEVKGRILEPTLLADVTSDMKVSCEEIFGPVIVVSPFESFTNVVDLVNDSRYGLQTGVFTNNINNAFYAIKNIESGGININEIPSFRADHMPYGGVKDSGIGKEGPKYSLEEMTVEKLVSFRI
ncbi:aldehyde dehydrogenase family protein [Cytobacillus depressus]|uniref:Aldehyde dehydrogenase family protein n=1 Tax=Cytobacillus depressus TaxID=1602942 RepID=A0A6L3V5A7_9BACI|nr:aldehyde dehydrogenase family protein [Cytobacillus depressus]KAB2336301.1 aldehyde dehydrogenase family protein [Cytobacillus depressus]